MIERGRKARAYRKTKRAIISLLMTTGPQFAKDLEAYVADKLSSLDLIKEAAVSADRAEVIRRLKMALKNELEASEVAALWMQSSPEIEIKLALARQVGDEAKHYKLIEKHLLLHVTDVSIQII